MTRDTRQETGDTRCELKDYEDNPLLLVSYLVSPVCAGYENKETFTLWTIKKGQLACYDGYFMR